MKISQNEFFSRIKHYLTPPGNGVFTVHTAKEKKLNFQKKLYGEVASDLNSLEFIWLNSIEKKIANTDCILLGIPSDTGGGILRGANWGPLFLRETLINSREELNVLDFGDVKTVPHLLHDKYLNEETITNVRKAIFSDSKIKLPVSPLSIAYDFAKNFHELYPLKNIFMIGGDHSVSYPMIKAYIEAKKNQNKKVAIIHFDAHTDLLEERLGIDLCFGTWASHILNELDSPSQFIQLGIRSSGKSKSHWENKFKIKQYWSEEILKNGPIQIANEIVENLKSQNIEEIYITFDIDCLDSEYASATGTPEENGLTPYEPMMILQILFENFKITGSDIVEIAPFVKALNSKQIEPESTLLVASSFATFLIQAMGKQW